VVDGVVYWWRLCKRVGRWRRNLDERLLHQKLRCEGVGCKKGDEEVVKARREVDVDPSCGDGGDSFWRKVRMVVEGRVQCCCCRFWRVWQQRRGDAHAR
jgi:hypothetical protein